jgi:hypothetical protein
MDLFLYSIIDWKGFCDEAGFEFYMLNDGEFATNMYANKIVPNDLEFFSLLGMSDF